MARRYGGRVVDRMLALPVEIIRGTPFLVQVFLLYYGGPYIGLELNNIPAGMLALSIYAAAYYSELWRAGFEAVPEGHIEAADCVGLSQAQTMGRIILPEMTMIMLPAMVNMSILMLKETAILSIISVPELTLTVSALGTAVLRLRRELHRAGAALLGPGRALRHRRALCRGAAREVPFRMTAAVRTSGLVKDFGATRVLDGISLDAARGEVTCIIGPSGSGKSTLLRCIAFLEEATDGLIEIDGEPLGFARGPSGGRVRLPASAIRACAATSGWCSSSSTSGRI